MVTSENITSKTSAQKKETYEEKIENMTSTRKKNQEIRKINQILEKQAKDSATRDQISSCNSKSGTSSGQKNLDGEEELTRKTSIGVDIVMSNQENTPEKLE